MNIKSSLVLAACLLVKQVLATISFTTGMCVIYGGEITGNSLCSASAITASNVCVAVAGSCSSSTPSGTTFAGGPGFVMRYNPPHTLYYGIFNTAADTTVGSTSITSIGADNIFAITNTPFTYLADDPTTIVCFVQPNSSTIPPTSFTISIITGPS